MTRPGQGGGTPFTGYHRVMKSYKKAGLFNGPRYLSASNPDPARDPIDAFTDREADDRCVITWLTAPVIDRSAYRFHQSKRIPAKLLPFSCQVWL
jgi:hypothetical protein